MRGGCRFCEGYEGASDVGCQQQAFHPMHHVALHDERDATHVMHHVIQAVMDHVCLHCDVLDAPPHRQPSLRGNQAPPQSRRRVECGTTMRGEEVPDALDDDATPDASDDDACGAWGVTCERVVDQNTTHPHQRHHVSMSMHAHHLWSPCRWGAKRQEGGHWEGVGHEEEHVQEEHVKEEHEGEEHVKAQCEEEEHVREEHQDVKEEHAKAQCEYV